MGREVYWSRFASDFDRRNDYVAGRRNIEAILEVLARQHLSGNGLELGCGSGRYSEVLADKADHFRATDYSEDMLAVTRSRLEHYPNTVVEKQSCFALTYPEAAFDFVVMVNLLHVIPDPEKALAEARRVLKKKGKMIVVGFTMEGLNF